MIRVFEKVRRLRLLGTLGLGVLATSCAQVGDSWILGSMSAAAKDQIMLVRKEPPSFGFQRLSLHSRSYPDMALFVSKHGVPNFLAETGKGEGLYFILYYLKQRQAFACRTRLGKRGQLEFAGPYPITEREFRLLDGFRRDPSRTPETW
jgi:hypothetical protein